MSEILPIDTVCFIKVFAVVLADFPQDAAGIADCHNVFGNVLRYDAPRADHAVLADTDAGNDHDVCADPDVFTDMYVPDILKRFFQQLREDRMISVRDRYVGAEHHLIADIDMTVVHKRQIVICVDV